MEARSVRRLTRDLLDSAMDGTRAVAFLRRTRLPQRRRDAEKADLDSKDSIGLKKGAA